MSRSPSHDPCLYGPGGNLYQASPEPAFAPGTDPDLDALFDDLSGALEAVPDPVAAAVSAMSAADVRAALGALSLPDRVSALRPLGMKLTPRKVGTAMAGGVLNRLRRASVHERRHAAAALGWAAASDVMMLVGGAEEFAQEAQERVDAWPPAVTRTALWANGMSSALGARIWVWAATQPWFAPQGASAEELEAVVSSARAVVEATPDFEFSQDDDADDDLDDDLDVENFLDAMLGEASQLVMPEIDPTPGDLDDLAGQVATLEAGLHAAADVALAVAARLGQGEPLDVSDVSVLWSTRVDFDRVAAAVRAAGIDFEKDSTPAIATAMAPAIEAARQSVGDQPVRDALGRVCLLRAPAGADAMAADLAGAVQRCAELAATPTWSPGERAEAGALTALADLAGDGVSVAHVFALQAKLVAARPDLALLAISAPTLTAPPAQAAPDRAPDVQDSAAVVAVAAEVPAPPPVIRATAAPAKQVAPVAPVAAVPVAAPLAPVRTTRPADVDVPDSDGDAPEDDAEVEPEADVAAAVADLIASGRHALAATLTAAAATSDLDDLDADVLTVAALADAVRGAASPTATELRTQIANLDSARIQTDTASLLLATTALLRTALVTGEPTAGAILVALEPHLEPHLGKLADEVGRRALQGVLLDAPPLTAVADAADLEAAMTAAQKDATRLLGPRKLRFKRAGDIAAAWFAPDGIIGAALTIVANDDRHGTDIVATTLKLLTDAGEMSSEVDARDRQLRSGSSSPLQGSGRGDLLKAAAEAVGPLSAWIDAAASLSRTAHSAPWSATEVAQMRDAVLENAPLALARLTTAAAGTDRLAAAAATAAAASLTETVALLGGARVLGAVELSPGAALGLDALHVAGARPDPVSAQVSMADGVTSAELVAATTRSWEDAVRLHVAAENFAAAYHLVAADASGLLAGPGAQQLTPAVVALVAASETAAGTELAGARTELAAELRTARTNNQITEEQDAELTALLADTKRAGADLAQVRTTLATIAAMLPHYSQRATTRLCDRLDRAAAEHGVLTADLARVGAFIADGDLATAEELIYLLETDEDLPSPEQHDDLALFFPAVPRQLPSGITPALVNVARARGVDPACPVLDFSGLSEDQAQLNAAALESWAELGATPPQQRSQVSESTLLLPALRMVGIEGMKVDQLSALPRHRDRRFVDIREVAVNGKAMVPAFGSKLGDRRRVMLAWGQPSAETLMSYVDQDPSGQSVIVAYFGTMSVAVRTDLAVRALSSSAPVVVLDDAALAYLAARGARLMDATMRVLLPFANVNPYIRQKRGLVAPEMFYGRNEERRQVIDPDGSQIIYGGRGLGKSALLRDAEAKFATQGQGGEQLALYLSLDDIGGDGPRSADAVWDTLLEHLIDRKIIEAKRSGRGSRSPHKQVVAGISAWLKESASRRMLILLDESDRFFESDAPAFVETSNIRNLGVTTNGHAKVVFAGLHSVQRFTKVAGNGPFSHLAQRPTVIGPLKPQYALDLLTAPMATMGYEFAEQDLVNRVLAYCSYQPFLLQMFGHRLVERMHEQRAVNGASSVPYVVTRADIDAVQDNADLREDISNAFRETLHLDPRYNVIANVMAKHAHEFGLDARLSDSELREECLSWWKKGFFELDVEAFRSYLSEMVGLGVLARNRDGRGWRLRGPAVRDMVGLPSEVDTQLLGAETESLRPEFVALETRIALADGRWSPLTAVQLDDILGDHSNQVRVILGSAATGIDMAAGGVRAATDIGARFTIPAIANRAAFAAELTAGEPGTRRVVLADLCANTTDVCAASLESALAFIPDRAGVTRSVALVAGTAQMGFWREVFSRQDDTPTLGTVALRRYDERTLKVWAMLAEKFRTTGHLDRLLAVTGGWPVLVERAAAAAPMASLETSVLDKLEAHLASTAGAAELVDLVGVCTDADLARAYHDLVEVMGDGVADLGDLHAAVSDVTPEPEAAVACLRALGVFTADASGEFALEPVLAAAWVNRP